MGTSPGNSNKRGNVQLSLSLITIVSDFNLGYIGIFVIPFRLIEKCHFREWSEVTRDISDISSSAVKARTHVGKLKESWQHLLRDRLVDFLLLSSNSTFNL